MTDSTALVVSPHLYLGDSTGRPLDYGMVYFGQPNKDPEFYPIDIFYDESLTIQASQPVRTKNGFMNASGDMVQVFAAELEYSVKVLDSYGRQVFSRASVPATVSTTDLLDRTLAEIARAKAAEESINDTISKTLNVTDNSKIKTNNVSGKMICRIAQYATADAGTVGSRYYVCVSKGGIKDSYVFFEMRRGATTSTGSVGGNAEFLRITSVYEGASAWTGRHGKLAESALGDWLEVVYTPTGYTDTDKFSRSTVTGVDCWKYYQAQGAGVKFITFNTMFDKDGKANIQFYATNGSATDVNIYIDDVLYKSLSLKSTEARISRLELSATAGYHVVKIERPTTGTVNVFGVNYSDVSEAKYGQVIDGFVMWHNNVMFTSSEGANDYAIIDANSELFAGSFHGGEKLNQETFVIDGVVGDPMGGITLCKSIEIRQKTKIEWSVSTYLNTYSTHSFVEDGGYQLDVTFGGNVDTKTFYTVMHATPNSFNIVPYPNLLDFSTLPSGFKSLDRSNVVVQEDATTGKRVYTEMTLFNNDYGNIYKAPTIRKVDGSYNKLYYGIAISSPVAIKITSLKSTFKKQFV